MARNPQYARPNILFRLWRFLTCVVWLIRLPHEGRNLMLEYMRESHEHVYRHDR